MSDVPGTLDVKGGVEAELVEIRIGDGFAATFVEFERFGEHPQGLGFRLAEGGDARFEVPRSNRAVVLVDEFDALLHVVVTGRARYLLVYGSNGNVISLRRHEHEEYAGGASVVHFRFGFGEMSLKTRASFVSHIDVSTRILIPSSKTSLLRSRLMTQTTTCPSMNRKMAFTFRSHF